MVKTIILDTHIENYSPLGYPYRYENSSKYSLPEISSVSILLSYLVIVSQR